MTSYWSKDGSFDLELGGLLGVDGVYEYGFGFRRDMYISCVASSFSK